MIEILGIEGKWKVSQNRPAVDRVGVATGLEAQSVGGVGSAMADLVREHGGPARTPD